MDQQTASFTDIVPSRSSTPGAKRTRESRQRRRDGAVVIGFVAGRDAIEALANLGWIDASAIADRVVVQNAMVNCIETVIEKKIRAS